MIIYKITNKINGKVYIGQTIRTLKERWRCHLKLKRGSPLLINAIKKYGKDAFEISIVEVCNSLEDLNLKEENYINQFKSLKPFGYNINAGGKNSKRDEETKNKISKKLKNRTFSEETLKKMSESKKGTKSSKRIPVVGISKEESIFLTSFGESIKLGFQPSNIHKCCNKLRNSHKGYIWYYFNDFMELNHDS